MSIKSLVAVALGGALGAIARYVVVSAATHILGHQFPYGTLLVNIIGSFIMGMLIDLLAISWQLSAELRLFLLVGVLGAFTTFSTFSLDVALLFERGRMLATAMYIILSVVLSITALFAGMTLTRRFLVA